MTPGHLGLLAGLFLVPLLLLWLGHGYRTLSPLARRCFWGGLLGFLAGLGVTLVLMLLPPVLWPQGATAGAGEWRTVGVHWGLVLGAVAGVAVGAALGWRRRHELASDED